MNMYFSSEPAEGVEIPLCRVCAAKQRLLSAAFAIAALLSGLLAFTAVIDLLTPAQGLAYFDALEAAIASGFLAVAISMLPLTALRRLTRPARRIRWKGRPAMLFKNRRFALIMHRARFRLRNPYLEQAPLGASEAVPAIGRIRSTAAVIQSGVRGLAAAMHSPAPTRP